ncbi:MAG: ParA family protein [Rhodospirillaceae bacterium]
MANRPHVIAISSQKGGVGKTTTAVNLSAALAAAGRTVLLIDCDPQGNASACLGFAVIEHGEGGTHQLLTEGASTNGALWPTRIPGLSVSPASLTLATLESELANCADSHVRLAEAAESLAGTAFDFVIIDCPPSLGILTVNALVAADRVVVPLPCDVHALQGLNHLDHVLASLALSAGRAKPAVDVLLTMHRHEGDIHGSQTLAATVRRSYSEQVLTTEIPLSHEISAAAALGKPVLLHRPRSTGSSAYVSLAVELVQRLEDHAARVSGRVRRSRAPAWDPVAAQMAIATRLIGWVTDPASALYDVEAATEHQSALRATALAGTAERSFGLRRHVWIGTGLVLAALMLGPILFFGLARLAPLDWRLKAVSTIIGTRTPWEAGTTILAHADPRAQKLLLLAATLVANPSQALSDCIDRTDFEHGAPLPSQMPCLIALTVTPGLTPGK